MKKTVLISAPYLLPFLDRFRPVFDHYGLELIVPDVDERLSEDELLQYAGQFDGAICGDDRLTARVIEACVPRLKVLVKWGTGIDSFDQAAAARLGVAIRNTPNAFTMPVADSVMGYILAFARRQPWMDRNMKAGQWEKIPGRSLNECTIGVIGVGNCGKAVLRRASAFGMQLLGNDIVEIAPDFVAEYRVEMTSLEDLLSRADFISVNCDLNPTSYHIINADTLRQMQSSAVLINTARGAIVDQPALFDELRKGRLRAGLDVLWRDMLPEPFRLALHSGPGNRHAALRRGYPCLEGAPRGARDEPLLQVHEPAQPEFP